LVLTVSSSHCRRHIIVMNKIARMGACHWTPEQAKQSSRYIPHSMRIGSCLKSLCTAITQPTETLILDDEITSSCSPHICTACMIRLEHGGFIIHTDAINSEHLEFDSKQSNDNQLARHDAD